MDQYRRQNETDTEYLARLIFGEQAECPTCEGSGYVALAGGLGFMGCKECQ